MPVGVGDEQCGLLVRMDGTMMTADQDILESQKPMCARRTSLFLVCTATFALAAAVRLLYIEPPRLVNDSADYLSCAANIAAGRGFLSDVKIAFVTPGPARHHALGERPPAYPAFLAAFLLLSRSEKALFAANVFLGALPAAAVAALAGVAFGVRAAWVAGLIGAFCSILVSRGVTVEPAALYGAWLAFLAAAGILAGRNMRWAPVAGLLWAVAALTRGEGLYVGLAVPVWLATNRSWRALSLCMASFVAAMAPYWAANAAVHGSPFFSVHSYHLRVRRFSEAMWDGYGRTYPSAVEFLQDNWRFVLRPIARNAYRYATALGRLDWAGAGLVIAALSWLLKRWKWPADAWALVLMGVFQWTAVSLMWSTTGGMPEPEHLASPLVVLALPITAAGIVGLAAKRTWATAALAGLVVATYVPGNLRLAHEQPPLLEGAEVYQRAAEAAADYLGPNDVVASCRPWLVWWFLRGPAIFLPRGLSRKLQLRFLDEYDVRAIVDWRNQIEPWLGLPGLEEVFRDPSYGVTVLLRRGGGLGENPPALKGCAGAAECQ